MPGSFAETSQGLVFYADGFGRPAFWDGLTSQMEPVGLSAPSAAPILAGSGSGPILGTYFAFVRFADRFANVSDLSPISAEFTAENLTGAVTGASNTTPIVINSINHGLATGSKVRVQNVGGNTGANATWIVTVLDFDNFSLDDSEGSADFTSGGAWTAGIATLTYSSVAVPTEAKVTRRQILRNTDGQTNVFYVDVDTTDLVTTTFASTRDDNDLSAQTPQTLIDPTTQADVANVHGLPPFHKGVLANHLDRMFAAVEYDWKIGNVQTTYGSAVVTGVGTGWPSALAGRFLYVDGASRNYEILSVNVAAQTLTLTEVYADAASLFAFYAIRPAPPEERKIYFSEPSLPQSWPTTNAISLPHDNDRITGLMPRGAFLYVLEQRHIYKETFLEGPQQDGAVFKASDRGCINNRCWILVDNVAYLLDEQGIHKFVGNNDDQPVSVPIQDIFRIDQLSAAGFRVNWRASRWFHAVHYRARETIRWFVNLEGEGLPQHAICFHYRLQRFWIESYAAPIGGSQAGLIDRLPCLFLGSLGLPDVWLFWRGNLDGPDPAAGTVRGAVTAATPISLSDNAAAFPAAGVVGASLVVAAGRGKGQRRRITQVSGTTLLIEIPWLITPDSTSIYQIGGIPWKWRSSWLTLAPADKELDRRLEIIFEPTADESKMDLRLRANFRPAPVLQGVSVSSSQGSGVKSVKNQADLEIDLAQEEGFVQQVLPFTRDYYARGLRHSQVELEGVGGQDRQTVYQVAYEGALPGPQQQEGA